MSILTLPSIPVLDPMLIGHQSPVYYPTKSAGTIYGRRVNIGNAGYTLWEGPTNKYVFPTAPMQMRIVSTSAQDGVGGTGLRAMRIAYLDDQYNGQSVDITLNGTTPVLTVPTNILRVNRVYGISAGSLRVAAGTITLTNTAGTVTYSQVSAGDAVHHQAVFTVPNGYIAYLTSFTGSAGSSSGTHFTEMELVTSTFQGVYIPGVDISSGAIGLLNSGMTLSNPTPTVVPYTADIMLTVNSDASNAAVTANGAFKGWLEKVA